MWKNGNFVLQREVYTALDDFCDSWLSCTVSYIMKMSSSFCSNRAGVSIILSRKWFLKRVCNRRITVGHSITARHTSEHFPLFHYLRVQKTKRSSVCKIYPTVHITGQAYSKTNCKRSLCTIAKSTLEAFYNDSRWKIGSMGLPSTQGDE